MFDRFRGPAKLSIAVGAHRMLALPQDLLVSTLSPLAFCDLLSARAACRELRCAASAGLITLAAAANQEVFSRLLRKSCRTQRASPIEPWARELTAGLTSQHIQADEELYLSAPDYPPHNMFAVATALKFGRIDRIVWIWSRRARLPPQKIRGIMLAQACRFGTVDTAKWVARLVPDIGLPEFGLAFTGLRPRQFALRSLVLGAGCSYAPLLHNRRSVSSLRSGENSNSELAAADVVPRGSARGIPPVRGVQGWPPRAGRTCMESRGASR